MKRRSCVVWKLSNIGILLKMKMFDQTSFPDILMSFFQIDVGLQMWLPLSKIKSLQYKNDDLSFCGTLRMPTELENGPLISDFRGSVIYFTKPNLAFRYNDLESIGLRTFLHTWIVFGAIVQKRKVNKWNLSTEQ